MLLWKLKRPQVRTPGLLAPRDPAFPASLHTASALVQEAGGTRWCLPSSAVRPHRLIYRILQVILQRGLKAPPGDHVAMGKPQSISVYLAISIIHPFPIKAPDSPKPRK